eukprot:TRINITY_DN24745_c0_g1_i1.p1 TRINITY_DN24745_c0_g1~~TRINITY_DN24745_c0_g1_i1.p1  ORF type:complete len:866 (+),score=104.26 TRINITY_DN24745_c0_g1_i1:90-2687(+)
MLDLLPSCTLNREVTIKNNKLSCLYVSLYLPLLAYAVLSFVFNRSYTEVIPNQPRLRVQLHEKNMDRRIFDSFDVSEEIQTACAQQTAFRMNCSNYPSTCLRFDMHALNYSRSIFSVFCTQPCFLAGGVGCFSNYGFANTPGQREVKVVLSQALVTQDPGKCGEKPAWGENCEDANALVAQYTDGNIKDCSDAVRRFGGSPAAGCSDASMAQLMQYACRKTCGECSETAMPMTRCADSLFELEAAVNIRQASRVLLIFEYAYELVRHPPLSFAITAKRRGTNKDAITVVLGSGQQVSFVYQPGESIELSPFQISNMIGHSLTHSSSWHGQQLRAHVSCYTDDLDMPTLDWKNHSAVIASVTRPVCITVFSFVSDASIEFVRLSRTNSVQFNIWRLDVEEGDSFHRVESLAAGLLSLTSLIVLASFPLKLIRILATKFLGQLSVAYSRVSTMRFDMESALMTTCAKMIAARQQYDALADTSARSISEATIEKYLASSINVNGHIDQMTISRIARKMENRRLQGHAASARLATSQEGMLSIKSEQSSQTASTGGLNVEWFLDAVGADQLGLTLVGKLLDPSRKRNLLELAFMPPGVRDIIRPSSKDPAAEKSAEESEVSPAHITSPMQGISELEMSIDKKIKVMEAKLLSELEAKLLARVEERLQALESRVVGKAQVLVPERTREQSDGAQPKPHKVELQNSRAEFRENVQDLSRQLAESDGTRNGHGIASLQLPADAFAKLRESSPNFQQIEALEAWYADMNYALARQIGDGAAHLSSKTATSLGCSKPSESSPSECHASRGGSLEPTSTNSYPVAVAPDSTRAEQQAKVFTADEHVAKKTESQQPMTDLSFTIDEVKDTSIESRV